MEAHLVRQVLDVFQEALRLFLVDVLCSQLRQVPTQLVTLRLDIVFPKDLDEFFGEKFLAQFYRVLSEDGAEHRFESGEVLLKLWDAVEEFGEVAG